MALRPTAALQQFPESQYSFAKYLTLFAGTRRTILEILAGSALVLLFGMAAPLFLQMLFDLILNGASASALRFAAGIAIAATAIAGFAAWARANLINHLFLQVQVKFSSLFTHHVL